VAKKQDSGIHRNGIFAVSPIKKGEMVCLWGGYVMTSEEFDNLPKQIRDYEYPISIYDGFFIGPKVLEHLDDDCEMFNHSCDPNAGIKGQVVLVARRDIEPGEEVCFDYETSESGGMHLECKCGSAKCRKLITGECWKDPEFQKANRGYFSWYIQDKIDKLNGSAND
jgi:SET domain-containing protein